MPSCTEYTCGTGTWSGPKPGDPDNNSALSAVSAYGGIDLSWTYPATNPGAVAHARLFRAILPQFDGALQIAVVGGNFFHDRQEPGTVYYYWIQFVSINGTIADPIGPASAEALPLIEDYLRVLAGKIDAGTLAATLRNEINKIPVTAAEVQQEILNRIMGDATLEGALALMQAGVTQALAFIDQERTVRIDGQNALAQQIDTLAAMNGGDAAALVQAEQVARIEGDQVLAAQINSAYTAMGDNVAGVETRLQSNIDTMDGKVTDIGALYTARLTVNGLIGGFGLYNDGSTVQAGFDVDTFWVGRTNSDKRKPFIVIDGVTYIDQAVIRELTFSKLRDEAGGFVVQGGKIKTEYLETRGLVVRDGFGNPVFSAGTGLDWSYITNRPRINQANISTWVDGAAIGSAYIDYLAVKEANLDTASVSTLKIQGYAVNIPVTTTLGSPVGIGWGWTDILVAGIDFPDVAPQSVSIIASLNLNPTTAGTATCIFRLIRDGGPELGWSGVTINGATSNSLVGLDTPGIGYHVYRLQAYLVLGATTPVSANSAALVLLGSKR
jgi:hypothetical protein